MSREHEPHVPTAAVTIRKVSASESDKAALERLAEVDSAEVPAGPVLVAEVEGVFLAAISLTDGTVIADPFSRTDEMRSLLELRAAQIRRRRRPSRRRIRINRSRGALAGSPPGAGGRLIELPRWG